MASSSSSSSSTTGAGPCTQVFPANFTIQTTADVQTILPYCEIDGNLVIDAPNVTSIALPNLVTIDGALDTVSNNSTLDLQSLSLPALTSVVSISFVSATTTSVSLPLAAPTGGATIEGPLTSVDLASVVVGPVTIKASTAPIALPALTTGPVTVTTSANVELLAMTTGNLGVSTQGSVAAPLLANAGGVGITAGSVDLSSLVSSAGDVNLTIAAAVSLPQLTTIDGIFQVSAPAVTLPKLQYVGGQNSAGLAIDIDVAGPVSLPLLTTVGSGHGSFAFDARITSGGDVTLAALPSVGQLTVGGGGDVTLSVLQSCIHGEPAFVINAPGTLSAPKLKQIDGSVQLVSLTTCDLPLVKMIGGNLALAQTNLTTFSLPSLTQIGQLGSVITVGGGCQSPSPNLVSFQLPALPQHVPGADATLVIDGAPLLSECRIQAVATYFQCPGNQQGPQCVHEQCGAQPTMPCP